MSAARRDISLGPLATLDLSECLVDIYDDMHLDCNPGCVDDCAGLSLRHKPSGLFTEMIYKRQYFFMAIADMARKVKKWRDEQPPQAPPEAGISLPPELQDMET